MSDEKDIDDLIAESADLEKLARTEKDARAEKSLRILAREALRRVNERHPFANAEMRLFVGLMARQDQIVRFLEGTGYVARAEDEIERLEEELCNLRERLTEMWSERSERDHQHSPPDQRQSPNTTLRNRSEEQP